MTFLANKKMAEKFDQDALNFLMEDNKVNNEKFNEFHKKMFNEMVFLTCDLLQKKGERRKNDEFNKRNNGRKNRTIRKLLKEMIFLVMV